MATLGLRGHPRLGGFKLGRGHLKAVAVMATVLLVPLAGSVTILSLRQVIPRHSYAADGGDCSRYTRLAFRAGAPSPVFVLDEDRCEIHDYEGFVQAARRYNLGRGLWVGAATLGMMAALLFRIFRARA